MLKTVKTSDPEATDRFLEEATDGVNSIVKAAYTARVENGGEVHSWHPAFRPSAYTFAEANRWSRFAVHIAWPALVWLTLALSVVNLVVHQTIPTITSATLWTTGILFGAGAVLVAITSIERERCTFIPKFQLESEYLKTFDQIASRAAKAGRRNAEAALISKEISRARRGFAELVMEQARLFSLATRRAKHLDHPTGLVDFDEIYAALVGARLQTRDTLAQLLASQWVAQMLAESSTTSAKRPRRKPDVQHSQDHQAQMEEALQTLAALRQK